MKQTKRIIAIILTLTLALGGGALTAFAEYGNGNGYPAQPADYPDYLYQEDDDPEPGYDPYIPEDEGEPTAEIAPAYIPIMPLTAPTGPVAGQLWSFSGVTTSGGGDFGGGSWQWDNTTSTLTLTNIRFTTSNIVALAVPAGTTIELIGTNEMISTHSGVMNHSRGIWSHGNLTFTGSGAITATAGSDFTSSGIYVNGNLTIESGTINATSGAGSSRSEGIIANGSIIANGGEVNAQGGTSTQSTGLASFSDITLNDGVINTGGDDFGIIAMGNLTVGNGAVLNVTDGEIRSGGAPLFVVTFDPTGGTVNPASRLTNASGVVSFPTPTRGGHTFNGWFAAATGGDPLPADHVFAAHTTVHAQWTASGSGIPPTCPPHTWGEWLVTTPATATTDGVETRTCTTCGVTETRAIPALGGNQPPSGNGDRDNDRGNGGGIISAIATVFAPAERWLTATDVAALPQAHDGSQRSTHNGRFGIRGAAWASFGFAYSHDTTDSTGVQVRTFINNPRAMTGDVFVSAWVFGNDVNWTRNHFERFFSNDIRVVSFDHVGAFGQSVRAATRVDLTGMDVENLRFYSYDRAANTFRPIAVPNYRVDANGFLWFSVEQGGAIVVSDGPLARR